jgi:aspartate aminotransferase
MSERSHVIDGIELGGIVTVRDRLIAQQAEGKTVYRLESGDPSFSVPPHVVEAICQALRDGHTHYTAGAGIMPLREAVFHKLREENGMRLAGPQSVLVTNGAMHALYIAFRALCQPGDEIIIPDPTWTETADNVTLAGGVPVRVPLDPATGYRYQAAAIAEKLGDRTRAIVVNSPHNPTGMVGTHEEFMEILELASSRGLWVLSDEAYEHVLYDGREHLSPASLGYDRVISVFSMSKSYAMAGLRLGYLAVDDPLILERLAKLLRCTANGVNSATQHGAIAALTGPQDTIDDMAAEFDTRRTALWESLEKAPLLHPFLPEGAFYMWCRIDESWAGYHGKRDSWAMTEYLIDEISVGSAPGVVFGPAGRGHLRFAFSCATGQVLEAAKRLHGLLG